MPKRFTHSVEKKKQRLCYVFYVYVTKPYPQNEKCVREKKNGNENKGD